jgi:hypothetical protein
VYTIIETPTFTRQWPDYKVRWSRPGTGKRGGVRVIHYNRLTDGVIYLLVMYAKGVKDSIPAKTLNTIRETIDG